MTNEITNEELARLKKYVARRKEVSGLDIEHVHAFDTGCTSEAKLLLSDIEVLIAKVESLNRSNLELSRRHDEQKLQEQRLDVALAREKTKVESLAADAEQMDWLVQRIVEVRAELRYGSKFMFISQAKYDDEEFTGTTLREQIAEAMAKEKA